MDIDRSDILKDLQINEKFNCLDDLQNRVKEYEDFSNCMFYRRDSVTIEKCRKRGIKRPIEPELGYYSIKYCCIHGGKNFVSRATGQRSSKTFQKECQSFFRIKVSEDGKSLYVSEKSINHNHQTTRQLYMHLCQVRRMNEETKKKVKDLVNLKANKTKIKNLIEKETNKIVLMKDIYNLSYDGKGKNKLEKVEEILTKKFKADSYFLIVNNVFKGLFFATPGMKSTMMSYPEYIGVDGTFKLLNIRAPVYILIAEDPNGCTEIVGVSILINEDKTSIEWMMDCFKNCHPSWKQIKCVMTDKDVAEREAIRTSMLPNEVNLLLCAFHTLRSFNREITTDKRNITKEEKDEAKAIMEKMVYAETEERYNELYNELKKLSDTIVDYFNENWHHCRQEWTLSTDYMQHNFGNTTNNRLESLNAKLKKNLDQYMSLEEFVTEFLTLVECFHRERDHKAAASYHKTLVLNYPKNSAEYRYAEYLTNHAFRFVRNEFNYMNNLQLNFNNSLDVYEELISPTIKISSTSTSCSCVRHTSMQLPCRHILMVRRKEKIDLFEESLCTARWTNRFYYQTQRIFSDSQEIDVPEAIVSSKKYKKKILSEHEKYRKANEIAKQLPALVAEVGTDSYVKRLRVLTNLIEAWQNNEVVKIIKIGKQNSEGEDEVKCKTDDENEDNDENQNDVINHNDGDIINEDNNINKIYVIGDGDTKSNVSNKSKSDDGDSDDDDEMNRTIKYVEPQSTKIENNQSNTNSQIILDNSNKEETNAVTACCKEMLNQPSTSKQSLLLQTILTDTLQPNQSNNYNKENEIKISKLSDVAVQPAIKRKGRPRGTDKKVIGLPKKIKTSNKNKQKQKQQTKNNKTTTTTTSDKWNKVCRMFKNKKSSECKVCSLKK